MIMIDGGITSPLGFKTVGVHCGIKREKKDLAVIFSERPAFAAMTYTQNKMRAAPIELMMERDSETLQAFVRICDSTENGRFKRDFDPLTRIEFD